MSVEQLTDDDWDEIEDGLTATMNESLRQAEDWIGRSRESRYRAEAERTRTTLAKVQSIRSAGPETKSA